MSQLTKYGWSDQLQELKQSSNFHQLSHGRVTIVHRTCYEIVSEDGIFQCELTGNMLYGRSSSEYPCTGDWVIFQAVDKDKGIIVDVLPRYRTLYRKKSGAASEKQAIAAYVDKAFIVQSLDEHYNVRRIERFMLQILEEGITPVLILTKSDLGYKSEEINNSLKHLSDRMPVFFTSIHQPESIDELRGFIQLGETVVFTGLSGVGKSSLINALCGENILLTSEISESTRKGRHTSTRREMVLLEGLGVLIDTPGIKLFGVTADGTDTLSSMMNISDLEGSCRFKDCTHVNEPGCAVIEAVENGVIEQVVYDSYLKLRREAWHFTTAEHEKRRRDKIFTKVVRDVSKYKKNR